MNTYKIAASILSADFACLGKEVESVLDAGADIIHFDVMDNHFVPNLTIGPMVCQALRHYCPKAILDVHLMIEPVDALIPAFAKAGANMISFHPQATPDVQATIDLIHQHNCQAGLVINPDIAVDVIKDVIDCLELVVLMSVYPGFGGQQFIPETLDKIQQARHLIADRDIPIEVDGGIKVDNIVEVAKAGADIFVAGSAIFNTDDYKRTIDSMRLALTKSR
ncbi:MAG: ribulose-phosphate 3-epimerase [Pseudomonadota bacterium]